MANRKNSFLVKRSNIAGKVPVGGDLLLGELGLNIADVILYASGTTSNSILPIGWDRVPKTGGTMTGPLYSPTLSASTISGNTFYGDGSNLTGLTGSFGLTIDGAGSVITTGLKGYAVMPYNATIVGWSIVSNISGNCIVDVWKNTTIPTSGNSITGTEKPTLTNQQININNALTTWTTNISINDVIAFNVLSASSVSRINLIIKVIKK
jgi:hypothetical protein